MNARRRAGSPVQLVESGVVLQGPALLDVATLIKLGFRALRQDSIPPPVRLLELQAVVCAAAEQYRAMSDLGHADVRNEPDLTTSEPTAVGAVVGTTEAARILQVSTRHVRRLAPALLAVRRGAGYVFDRDAVESLAAVRRAEAAAAKEAC